MPAPDARDAWSDATSACRGVRTYSAELRLSGHAGASGSIKATAVAGLTSAGQIRLEIPAPFGRAAFLLAGTAARATLLTRDNRVLAAPANDIVEALVGVSLTPQAMLTLLAGCGSSDAPAGEPVRYGDLIAVGPPDARVYLRQIDTHWRVAAAVLSGLVVDYPGTAPGWPAQVRLTSSANRTPALSLEIAARQVEIDGAIDASAFVVEIPPGATPLTLRELRASGPLGER